ncbi:hypothetical protein ABIB40_004092 [Pedobacter sp. UYP30]|uniref:DUF1569 domain-containing protein n=1 Tax=Pedobacter sp. UYP30 TaxID=1756400 RepID=UPI0033972954
MTNIEQKIKKEKMKSVLDKSTRDELIARIKTLNESSNALWGKMNIDQMLKHCVLWEEMIAGKKKFKRKFLGYLFGRIALKGMIGNENDLKHGIPTLPELKVKETSTDVESEKLKWITLINENANFPNPDFIHPFCGKMTIEQIGYLAYKHTDHHLRQFNS